MVIKIMTNRIIRFIAGLLCIIGVIMFVVGASTGTVTGYKGADGQYYRDPDSVGSRDWMIMPGFFMGAGGGVVYFITSLSKDNEKNN